jgi:hypothetical protein
MFGCRLTPSQSEILRCAQNDRTGFRCQVSGFRAGRGRFFASLRMTTGGAELAAKGQSEILCCARSALGSTVVSQFEFVAASLARQVAA